MNAFPKNMIVVTSVLLASACSTQQKVQELHDSSIDEAMKLSQQAKQQAVEAERHRVAQQDVEHPYLVGKAIPLEREVSMPASLRKSVTVLFGRDAVDLPTAVRQISEASRVPISITADAMLPSGMFGPRLVNPSGPGTSSGNVSQPTSLQASSPRIMLAAIGQNIALYSLLDEVTRQAGVSWRVAGNGAEIYRTETRVFRVNGSPQSATASASLGRNGTSNQVFEAQSKTGFLLEKQDPLAGMRTTVEAMLSAGGRLTVSPESQTFVVTDTPQALDRVATYIEDMNKTLGRRVRVVVEAIEVVAKENSQFGLDWNMIYKSLNASGGSPLVNSTGLASLVGANAGAISAKATVGRFTGSTAMVRALSEVGRIVNRKTFPFVTTSGRPITQALRNTFNYVDSASLAQSSTITTIQQAPTVTQKEETVGTFLTVTPIAKDNGQIYVTISYDVTTADPLTPYTVGGASNSVTVQQKSINGTGIVQEIPMRSGQTVIVGGYDSVAGNLTERRLVPGAPIILGGSDSATHNKSIVVFLVTAVTEEGY